MKELTSEKIELTELQLLEIISRAMVNALKDDWLTPVDFTSKILDEHYLKIENELHALLSSEQEDERSVARDDDSSIADDPIKKPT
jgi:hypothetical protein